LLAGRVFAVSVLLLWAASCADLPGPADIREHPEEDIFAPAGAVVNAGSGGSAITYRRLENIAAFADGSPESAIALMRAAAVEPYALYLKLGGGSETVEPDRADPLKLPFEAASGTSPARVVINGGGRTISMAGTEGFPLLTVGDGVTLTLRNITFTGTGGSNAPLVEINGKGARLVLEAGAVIRGNTTADGDQAGGILVRKGTLELAGGKTTITR
jgi:hypothetical protein